ncbi:serine hydrolase [Deltaproteobacteria bacterium OttesenSCG-928-M10]|nr:serine hydrolase [Deltaproteobacteria bacterium OttesenSCG-928-M10]
MRWLLSLLTLVFLSCPGLGLAAETAKIDAKTMLDGAVRGYIPNTAFLPPEGAAKAAAGFEGTIKLQEAEMGTDPAEFKSREVMGKDPKIFPAAELAFITVGEDLVPASQEVLRYGSMPGGKSFWDIIVQPGKVWSEAGDEGWNRASFPFALVHSLEGETHNGVAMFLYKDGQVSKLHFQIIQMTAPFYVEDYFTAWGALPAAFDPAPVPNKDQLTETWKAALAAEMPLKPWAELEALVGKDKVAKFNTDVRPAESVISALYYQGKIYLQKAETPAGPLPYAERQRFGVWSVTKTLGNTTAMLRLAEKYGPEVFDLKVVDYITEFTDPGWSEVTFGDLLNMASGTGRGQPEAEPFNISGDQIDDYYYPWYESRSAADKIAAQKAETKFHSFGPGKVARYRDHDHVLLGFAMDRFLKSKEGPKAHIWTMLEEEVFKPIGIYYAPINRSIEDGEPGLPIMAMGYYPTVEDMVKIALLYDNKGKLGDRQILSAEMLADILPGEEPRGLPTGDTVVGTHYHKGTWQMPYKTAAGEIIYTVMRGWGGNYVLIFPENIIAVRVAKNWDGDTGSASTASMADTAFGLMKNK